MRKTIRRTLAPLLGKRGPSIEAQAEAIRPVFDAAFYRGVYRDLGEGAEDPVLHYLGAGWREGRDPSPLFSTAFYLERNPDVRAAGLNPLYHFVRHGSREGRITAPSDLAVAANPDLRAVRDLIAPEFDADFYLHTYPDVANTSIDPLLHFLTTGWKERRNPNRAFSTGYYLDNHPDVRSAGINPFWHYLATGRNEGRACHHPLGQLAEILDRLQPLSVKQGGWTRLDPQPELLDPREIAAAVSSRAPGGRRRLLLALTHDDYSQIAGGAQAVIRREEAEALSAGHAYLGVHPWQARPCLATESDPLLCLRFEGKQLGAARSSSLIEALHDAALQPGASDLVVHSLLGHSPETLPEIAAALGAPRAWVWLHDYFSICPNFTLQRNDVTYCGAPAATSAACRICVYGSDREAHLARLAPVFDRLDMTVVSPSQAALDVWTRANRLRVACEIVHPHLEISFSDRVKPLPVTQGPVRFGYLGATFAHKGWADYLALADRFAGKTGKAGVEFHYFGHYNNIPSSLHRTEVATSASDPDAMMRAVAEAEIDFVLHWSTWPETFSFTTFEAFAAGAQVLTSTVSGNVAAAVRSTGRGRVFEDFAALAEFCTGDDLVASAKAARTVRATTEARVRHSKLTLDLIAAEAARA